MFSTEGVRPMTTKPALTARTTAQLLTRPYERTHRRLGHRDGSYRRSAMPPPQATACRNERRWGDAGIRGDDIPAVSAVAGSPRVVARCPSPGVPVGPIFLLAASSDMAYRGFRAARFGVRRNFAFGIQRLGQSAFAERRASATGVGARALAVAAAPAE